MFDQQILFIFVIFSFGNVEEKFTDSSFGSVNWVIVNTTIFFFLPNLYPCILGMLLAQYVNEFILINALEALHNMSPNNDASQIKCRQIYTNLVFLSHLWWHIATFCL